MPSQNKNSNFSFDAVIEKAFKDDSGKMHVVAVASDTLPDRTNDEFSVSAIKSMARQAKTERLPFLENHFCSVEMGSIVDTDVMEIKGVTQLVIDVELDSSFPESVKLFNDVMAKKNKRQLSIGGKINLMDDDSVDYRDDKQLGLVRRLKKIDLDHVALTRGGFAANPRTGFVSAIVKAMDAKDVELGGEGANKEEKNADSVVVKKENNATLNKESELNKEITDKLYSGSEDSKLPDRIKKLPKSVRQAFSSTWNATYKKCGNDGESIAFAIANSVANSMAKKSLEDAVADLGGLNNEAVKAAIKSFESDVRLTTLIEKGELDEEQLALLVSDIVDKAKISNKEEIVTEKKETGLTKILADIQQLLKSDKNSNEITKSTTEPEKTEKAEEKVATVEKAVIVSAPANTGTTSNTTTVTATVETVKTEAETPVNKDSESAKDTVKIEPMSAKSVIEAFMHFLAKEKPELAKSLGLSTDDSVDGVLTKAVDLKIGEVEKKTLEAIEKSNNVIQKGIGDILQKGMGDLNAQVETLMKRIGELENVTIGSKSLKDSEEKKPNKETGANPFKGILGNAVRLKQSSAAQ